MGSAQLCDIWRDLNPAAMAFTHWSASTSSGKRLDRFLVSECFSPALTTAALPAATALSATSDILPSAPVSTDHLPVSLMVTCMTSGVPRGRGILSFPLRLLNSKEPSAAVSAFIVKTVPPLMVCPASELIGAFDAWKSAFIDMAVGVDKRHRRDRQAPARAADHCARSAREGMLVAAASGGDVGAAATIWLAQKDNAAAAWRALSASAWDVAATLDQNKGETSSYYFHHQACEMHTVTTMLSLNRPGRTPTDSPDAASFVSDAPKATKYVVDFFSSESSIGLFRPQLGIGPAAQHTLLTTLPRRLDGPFAALAEGVDCANDALAGMLTAEELQVALSHAARGKVPGGDGIPYEVYRHWRGSLSPLLLRVFNTGFGEAGRTSPTPFALLLRGVVCLLSKPGKPGDELDGYRPITLLNSDVKLVMSIIANRLQVPLDYLIDIGQGAFIHGRDISHNVRYHLALAARFRDLGLPGWLVHSDLTKAYDTVNRGWLDQAMIRMGFRPDGVVRWCRILLGGAKVRVRVNGFFTPDFPMDSGLFQGSALSCMEWVIVFQPVLSYLSSLQASGTLTKFRLPGPNGVGEGSEAPPAQAFADDVTLATRCPESDIARFQTALALSRSAGNPGESVNKFFFTRLAGPTPDDLMFQAGVRERHVATGYPLRDIAAAVSRHLGVPIAPDNLDAVVAAAYGTMAGSMLAATRRWAGVAPTLIGRAHVATQCIAAKLVYQAGFTMTVRALLQAMQQVTNRYVAASARAEEVTPNAGCLYPCAAVSHLPRGMGGIGLPDLDSHATAMRAKAIWQLFGFNSHPWAALYASEVAKPAAAVPHLPPGPLWVATQPGAVSGLSMDATSIVREGVKAFMQLRITRIMPPDSLSFESVMREATFGNDAVPGIDFQGLRTDAAQRWRRLWRLPSEAGISAGALRDRATIPTRQLDRHGLVGRDERCCRTLEVVKNGFPPEDVDNPVAWVRGVQSGAGPSAPRQPNRLQVRRSEGEAAAQAQPLPGGAPISDPDLPEGFAQVWTRLLDPTIHRPFVITAWRILHCCLGCNAFIAVKLLDPDTAPADADGNPDVSTACCGHPFCASLTDPPFETLAHTFLDCPAARPAMQWLCDTWAALTGGAPPPLTAAVMLADDMSGWSGAPVAKAKKKELRAWTRLRVTVIGAIWRVRCDRQASGLLGDSLALRAVRLALDSVTGAIRRDWQRTEEDITMVDDGFFCVDWWRGFDAERDKDWFCSQWATPPLLCAVLAAPGATTGDTTYTLDVRVGVVGQVPLPA
ncbi:hypothetical protein FOA52_009360 [Chlamydomonas sp. UWO 241]|nr:hypothetical protein FOA52_009360 [Chlamydomonas sp. UWO 241]